MNNYAIPIDRLMGLSEEAQYMSLGNGAYLTPNPNSDSPNSRTVKRQNPIDILKTFQTIHIKSDTSFFDPPQLERELIKSTDFSAWKIMIVQNQHLADIVINIGRPLFTYTFTYTMTHEKTSLLLSSDDLIAFDGNAAAPGLAKKIIKAIKAVRPLPETAAENKKNDGK